MTTLYVRFSDAEIRRQAQGTAKTLRDARYPALRFRFHQDRARGSWHVVVGGAWGKAGNYPDLQTGAMIDVLSQVVARRTAEPDGASTAQGLANVGQVLEWQLERQLTNRALSAKRKASARSILKLHLLPALRDLPLAEVSRSSLDRLLMWPLQAEYAPSFVRQVFGVLAVAFRRALELEQVASNPVAGLKFTDFVKARIRPKEARLRPAQITDLLVDLHERYAEAPPEGMLALMMLCHGCRVGETRVARWADITLGGDAPEWYLPAATTKTREEHRLPLTPQVCALLRRYRDWQQRRGYSGAYLFPGKGKRPISDSQATDIFASLGQGRWTSHDLRKLASTCWTDLGIDYLIGQLLLNHALRDLDVTYIHTTAAVQKRKALEQWHDWLDQQGFDELHGWTGGGSPITSNACPPTESAAPAASSAPTQWRNQ